MRALILGGGSLKGAYQAGAIQAVLESGFEPEAIYGISVGSLNATFLVHEVGKQFVEQGHINWQKAGHELIEFWIRNITRPEDVARTRSKFMLGYNALMRRFNGLLDNTPLRTLINTRILLPTLLNSPIRLKVGAVDIINGDLVYATNNDENILDYVFASSSLPFLMPAVAINSDQGKVFLDGGLREVAPLRVAIEDGAIEIVCVACHAQKIFNERFNHHSLLNLVERVKDITVNEIVNNDISWAEHFVEREKHHGRELTLTIIRPNEPLYVNILKFTQDDISRLIINGYRDGTAALGRKAASRSNS